MKVNSFLLIDTKVAHFTRFTAALFSSEKCVTDQTKVKVLLAATKVLSLENKLISNLLTNSKLAAKW